MKKIAIVTGCAKGIGKEIALELARDGYDIIGTYNTSLSEISLLKSRIESIGVKFNSYKLDLLNEDDINNFCNAIKKEFKKIDALVNNAALSLDNNFLDKTSGEFKEVLQVNLISPFLLIQRLYDIMSNGVIINISSTDGINTYSKFNMDYSASKAGLINLTKSLALELENIRIYSICPNWVDTESIREMNPEYLSVELNRVGQKELIDPKEVAKKVIQVIESNLKSGSIVVMEGSHE
ncbi:MAG: SDR family oxidoreductase [Bacilli bacterium]|nr:SDR family oxidoreductase [Bacilli bacterium]